MTSPLTAANIMPFIATAKPDEAKQFYSETLGLELIDDSEYLLIFAVGGGLTLSIQKMEEITPQPFTAFGWAVDNIAEAMASLVARGVEFEHYEGMGQDESGLCTFPDGDQFAWFKDPDGNTLSITQIPPTNAPAA